MERKIGFAPISHSGKECVLRVELLPHRKINGAEDRTCTYTSFREGTCSKSWTTPAWYKLMERKIGLAPISHSGKECVLRVELLPHRKINGAEDRTCTYTSFREGTCSKSWTTPAWYKLMERKIGLAPISHSGKECVLRVELLPLNPGGGNRIWTGDKGFADLCLTTWLCRQ